MGARAARPDVIRQPLALRVYIAVFMCVWCGGLLAGAVVGLAGGSPAALVLLLMVALGATVGYRGFRVSVEMDPHELVVRNYFRTRRVARANVEGFRVGPVANQPLVRTIYVMTRDGMVLPLDIAGRYYFGTRGKAKLAERLDALQRWLDQPEPHSGQGEF